MDCTISITNFAVSYTTIYLLSKIPGNTIGGSAARICKFAVFYMVACISVGFLYSMILLFAHQPLVLAVAWLWWGIQFWGVIVEDSEVLEQMVRANFVDWPEILLGRVEEMGEHKSEDGDGDESTGDMKTEDVEIENDNSDDDFLDGGDLRG